MEQLDEDFELGDEESELALRDLEDAQSERSSDLGGGVKVKEEPMDESGDSVKADEKVGQRGEKNLEAEEREDSPL